MAKTAGVSPASVSRILNNDPTFHINEAARGRVIEIARKLNYNKADKKRGPKQPDSSLSVALVMRYGNMREFNDPYFLNMHKGIDEEAEKWHLRVEQPFKLDDPDKNWTDLANYGAVIIEGEMTAAAIEQIQNINPNVIFLDVNTNIRGCNIYIGGKSAVVNLDGKIVLRKDDLREDGYIAWMKMHNFDQYCHIFTANWSADEALEATNQLLQLKDRPTAIVVTSNPMALGVYKALNDANVNIPNDISVASFDDVEINRFLTLTLSSIDMNTEEMGKATIRFICFRQLTY
ncbi:LacI family DNA-binding transcriptional regulator [Lactobacillus amylovorus]|uniref:LacI family DNA-binding transcriptional regulator n=1 Tax=Lactobacillus amylovorus TaxID=1604 RepID=UPI00233150ED|nr:LacI family DNA-binding transcriptional regulator [Lactobacillus amylovorus]MDB6233757.1 LacI family DNA-binding transcriptional regulator [Lactobacillus amylovorus]